MLSLTFNNICYDTVIDTRKILIVTMHVICALVRCCFCCVFVERTCLSTDGFLKYVSVKKPLGIWPLLVKSC